MRLQLLFTRRQSRPLPTLGWFENADKSGALSKRYGFICHVNSETAPIRIRLLFGQEISLGREDSKRWTSAVLLTFYSLSTLKLSTGVLLRRQSMWIVRYFLPCWQKRNGGVIIEPRSPSSKMSAWERHRHNVSTWKRWDCHCVNALKPYRFRCGFRGMKPWGFEAAFV